MVSRIASITVRAPQGDSPIAAVFFDGKNRDKVVLLADALAEFLLFSLPDGGSPEVIIDHEEETSEEFLSNIVNSVREELAEKGEIPFNVVLIEDDGKRNTLFPWYKVCPSYRANL